MIVLLLIISQLHSPVGTVGVRGSMNGTLPDEIDHEIIDALAATNTGWVRLWLNWYQVENDSGSYDWTAFDSLVNTYSDHAMKMFITLQGGNQWYDTLSAYPESIYHNPHLGLPPIYRTEAMQAWLNFVSTAVNRYKDRATHWSIWNEPNLADYWQPVADSIGYLNLVRQTSPIIWAADSQAKIITGNTSLIDYEYLNAIIDSLIPFTDFIGFHPYRRYAEEDQDSLAVAGSIIQPTPMNNFEEEMDSLLTLLRSADPTNRVKLWDEESGYPSDPERVLWETGHNCDTVQVKNVIRKYLLDFAHFVEVSTYWGDFDPISIFYNALGESWVDVFHDMTLADWYAKEHLMLFNYIGVSFTPQRDTVWKEAEDYDNISGSLFLSNDSTYIFYPDTFPDTLDPNTYAQYLFTVPENGNYTLWFHMRNPVLDKIPLWIGFVDTSYYFIVQTINPDETSRFIWTCPFDAELLKLSYWQKGPHFFNLRNDTSYVVTIYPLHAGSEMDKIGLKREAAPSSKKLSYTAIDHFAHVWDGRWYRDTLLTYQADSGTVPGPDWQELRSFVFEDTVLNKHGIAYWLGIAPYNDVYPDYQMDMTLWTNDVDQPQLIDFRDGSIVPLNYTTTDSTVTFQDLPVSDMPRFIVLDINSLGVVEYTNHDSNKNMQIIMPTVISGNVLEFQLNTPNTSDLSIKIFDVAGRHIIIKKLTVNKPGKRAICIPLDVPAGVYFLKVNQNGKDIVKKFVEVR